ncbi:unnamed protein product [Mytilus edulis]|uniref:Ankyrin repeat protein n=1 Tax=Mytilus edulis TaxID=6550 RepID=A0A8S3RS51_MYTED|nr:unnamed protein product [Mytilus edulis]
MNAVHRFSMENYKHLIKLFLENVDRSLINFREVLNKACNDSSLDTVTWLLTNYDHALFDLGDAMRKACEWGESRIITYLVENCDNTLLDITGAMTMIIRVLENNINNDRNEEIIKYLFWKVNKDLIDDKMLENMPYKLALPFIVTWCLERFDNSTHSVSKAIIHRISLKHGYMNMVKNNEGLTLIQKLITDVNSENVDIKEIMNEACSFGCFDTVNWLLDNKDHSIFDLKMAMCNTFNSSCL